MTADDILDLSVLAQRDYSKLNLKFNPFPSSNIPSETHIITADRRRIVDKFKELLTGAIFEGNSSSISISGNYGSGKTHLLLYFKDRVNSQLSHMSDTKTLAVYVQSIGSGFKDTCSAFIEGIGRSFLYDCAIGFIRTLGADRLEHYMSRAVTIDKWISGLQSKASPVDTVYFDTLLRQSDYGKLFDELRRSAGEIGSSDLVYALLHLAHPDMSSLAWRWLLGEKLDKASRTALMVSNNIDDDAAALDILDDLILFLKRKIGFKAVVVLMDEVESFTGLAKSVRDRFLYDLRHFIDNNDSGFLLVLALTPAASNALLEAQGALSRRLRGAEFVLDLFNLDDTRELIERYLHSARPTDKRENEDIISPFTLKSTQRVHELSGGLPGEAIRICGRSIEEAQKRGLGLIDEEFIDRVRVILDGTQ